MRSPVLLSLAAALLSAGCARDDSAEDGPSVGGSIADSFETAADVPPPASQPSVDADTSVSVEPPPEFASAPANCLCHVVLYFLVANAQRV